MEQKFVTAYPEKPTEMFHAPTTDAEIKEYNKLEVLTDEEVDFYGSSCNDLD